MIFKQIKIIYKLIIPFLLMVISSNAHAVKWVGEMGVHVGGDKLATAVYTNGDTSSIRAGELISLSIGPQFELSDSTHIRTTFGYKFDSATADNGDIEFDRLTIDALYFYQTRNWNFGGGVTYHLVPELSGSGIASNINGEFDDALGFLAEVDFRLGEFFYLGAKLTFIDYEPVTAGLNTVDGNSVGIVMGFVFGD